MKYLKTFEQISNQLKTGKLDKLTADWCDGLITESEFLFYLDGQINEGLLDWLKGLKEKIVDMFYTFVIKAYEIGLYFDGVKAGRDCECCGDRWNKYCDEIETEDMIALTEISATSIHYSDGRIINA